YQCQVLALLEAGQVADLLADGFEHVDVLELFLGEVGLGLMLEHGTNRGFQILVGNEGGLGPCRPARARDEAKREEKGSAKASTHAWPPHVFPAKQPRSPRAGTVVTSMEGSGVANCRRGRGWCLPRGQRARERADRKAPGPRPGL